MPAALREEHEDLISARVRRISKFNQVISDVNRRDPESTGLQ